MVNIGIWLGYILIFVSASAALGLPLYHASKNPKSLKKIGISFGSLLVLYLICYILSGDETFGVKISSSGAKAVGGGIIMFYVILAITIVSIVYSEFSKLSK